MSKSGIFTLLFVLAVGGMVWMGLQGSDEVECEVCITFNGRTECRTGKGRDQAGAVQVAQTAACAVMTNGRAEVVRCGNLRPDSISCD